MAEDVQQILFLWDRRLAECSLQDIEVMYREHTLQVDSFIAAHQGLDGEADQAQLLIDELYRLIYKRQDSLTTAIVM